LSDRFRNNPDRQLAVLLTMNRKLVAEGPAQAGTLAGVQQQIGNLYLDKADRPADAVPYLLAALNYWDAQAKAAPGVGIRTVELQETATRAYLRAKKYKDGVAFAASRIARPNEGNMEVVGREIIKEIDRLDRANQLRDAIELATEAKALPLTGQLKDQLLARDESLRKRVPGLRMPGDEWWVTFLA
jgi:hypothetical protein